MMCTWSRWPLYIPALPFAHPVGETIPQNAAAAQGTTVAMLEKKRMGEVVVRALLDQTCDVSDIDIQPVPLVATYPKTVTRITQCAER